ncbi:zinc metalloproteinase nas-8-like [Tetranychus urticae]|uniref:zinc metalloproteinase nas-8-like n=1 Tax=Tetranychus urticae TaxID=32264 RepID=UPI000D64E9A6|nr:zinc metalloproteinase nas-8-like [Tetranychus urticae]
MVNSTISIKIATLIIISMLFIESTAKQSVCLVEGDIKCPKKSRNFSSQKHRPRNSVSLTRKRSYTNGPRDFNTLWPTRTIPYKISFDYSADQLSLLQKAMSSIESSTCIKFVPYSGQQDYVNIMRGKGCYSRCGRVVRTTTKFGS